MNSMLTFHFVKQLIKKDMRYLGVTGMNSIGLENLVFICVFAVLTLYTGAA